MDERRQEDEKERRERLARDADAKRKEEDVDEAGRESFPASDPPSFTPEGVGARGDDEDEDDEERNP